MEVSATWASNHFGQLILSNEPVKITKQGMSPKYLIDAELFALAQKQLRLQRMELAKERYRELQEGKAPLTHDEVFGQ